MSGRKLWFFSGLLGLFGRALRSRGLVFRLIDFPRGAA
jgi:hypothetical protein